MDAESAPKASKKILMVERLVQLLQKEAIEPRNDLAPANEKALETANSTKLIARQLRLLD